MGEILLLGYAHELLSGFQALQALPAPELRVSHEIVSGADPFRVKVTIDNPSPHLALAVNFRLRDKKTGKEIVPVLYEDNYFPLMPGETRG